VVATATQLTTASSGTLSIILDGTTNSSSRSENPQPAMERIQTELVSLRVRQAEVHKQIRYLRHALIALVRAFGHEILAMPAQAAKIQSSDISRRHVRIIDLSRRVLSGSTEWWTLNEVLDAIREECASVLSGYINPAVAVSNALRTLQRRGELECCWNGEQRRLRWIVNKQVPKEASEGSKLEFSRPETTHT
jgi:hypothetical protein